MQFTTDVKIEGKPLPAGLYGFHIAVGADQCTLIFSKNAISWGSYFYDEKEDALRVNVKPVVSDKSVEWLKYEFMNQTDSSAVIALQWEKWTIPFRVDVDYVNTQLESFRRELRTQKGFTWHAWQQAAAFCAEHNTNLEEGLAWAETSISKPFISEKNFLTLSTKAQLLTKLNRASEADAVMKEALPLGKLPEIHAYARQLLSQKRTKEALEAFKLNFEKHPAQFTAMVGMLRGYSATGDYKKALGFAKKALPLAPDKLNQESITNMIRLLEQGKDVN
jgi:tetratricopeptide (TPR) repeat protein